MRNILSRNTEPEVVDNLEKSGRHKIIFIRENIVFKCFKYYTREKLCVIHHTRLITE